jgi:RHS repeat-associated protein
MDRVRVQVSQAPGIVHAQSASGFQPDPSPAETLTVETVYDQEGNVRSVTRSVSPNPTGIAPQVTRYEYDAAGRRTLEDEGAAEGYRVQLFAFDHAGNDTSWTTPRQARITSQYDALNRLVRRTTPPAVYPRTFGACNDALQPGEPDPCLTAVFPLYPNNGLGYRVPEEWTYFRYDSAGNTVHAENADAIVQRSYFPNGALKTDTLRIRDDETLGFNTHAYGLRYTYDLAGRITGLEHPQVLTGSGGTLDRYAYHAVTGALEQVHDRLNNVFTFRYDLLGRPQGITMPGGVTDTLVYDLDGRLAWRRETSPAYAIPLQEEALVYDARGKLLWVNAAATVNREESTYAQWYSGLGNLVATDWSNVSDPQWSREQFRLDPLGNMARKRTYLPGPESPSTDYPDFAYTYDPQDGKVTAISLVDIATSPDPGRTTSDETRRAYDESGNVQRGYQLVEGTTSSGANMYTRVLQEHSYYGADEKLRAFQQYDDRFSEGSSFSRSAGVWEEYRYDPLGRRIVVRTRRESPLCDTDARTCTTSVTRFVWAGDQLLWEWKDAEGTYAGETGGRVSYTHAGGIDRPLAIWKQGVGTVITHQNWRGQFARGTFTNGQLSDCATYPPQGCVPVQWPGYATTAWHEGVATAPTTGYEHYWFGSLAVEMRDATGQLYRRNRYYDPQTGQFTQPDPIGLAGGLNAYGFAAGDPVSYSDPYGLSPADCTKNPTLVCRVGHAITNFFFGRPGDPNDRSGALASPGLADPVAIAAGGAATRLVRGRAVAPAALGTRGGVTGHEAVGRAVPNLGRKLDYLFGLATGSAHNVQRSRELARSMGSIGLHDTPATRQYIASHLDEVLNDATNIVEQVTQTRVMRESLLTGPGGAVKLQTAWEGNQLITFFVMRPN